MLEPSSGGGAAEILSDIRNHVAFVTLNRPAALNALSFGMIVELRSLMQQLVLDQDVHAVLLRGAGQKAFCAGGDIRALYQSFRDSSSLHHEFFSAEYSLDHMLHSYPKPYIALMDGITMGGGMGLAQGSTLRVVGERTRIAMPEVSIGFFPDVGASYFLSRLPGSLGTYLALTGTQIRGADAVYAGLADVYLGRPAIDALVGDLDTLTWSTDRQSDVRRFIQTLAADDFLQPALAALRPAIETHFSHSSVAAIFASLEHESREEYSDWARQTCTLMRTHSPTMLSVTLHQLQRGRSMNLADSFRMELGMARQAFVQGDFIEGIRALIIDKDNAPRWRPNQLTDVTAASVEAFFPAHEL